MSFKEEIVSKLLSIHGLAGMDAPWGGRVGWLRDLGHGELPGDAVAAEPDQPGHAFGGGHAHTSRRALVGDAHDAVEVVAVDDSFSNYFSGGGGDDDLFGSSPSPFAAPAPVAANPTATVRKTQHVDENNY